MSCGVRLKPRSKVLLLLSGGKDSPEALRRLQIEGYEVHGLCIDGAQGKEKVGAQEAADLFGIELTISSIPWFDEETWNPLLLLKRDIAMAATAIRRARAIGAVAIATGVKRTDIEHPALWWLGPFLKVCQFFSPMLGLKILFPVWDWNYVQPESVGPVRKKFVGKSLRRQGQRLFTRIIANLPSKIRYAVYRRFILNLPDASKCAEFTFEIARSKADLEAAFRLLHDAYVEQKFIEPQASGLRLLLQHALPTSTAIVAKCGDKVVGTVSLIRDNPLGLPMEKAFSVDEYRARGERLVEFSCLAIHPDYRREKGGAIFLPMLVFAYHYCRSYFGADSIVMNVFPQHADFYIGLFGGFPLQVDGSRQVVKDYLGAPATGVVINLRKTYDYARTVYRGARAKRNLFQFAHEMQHPSFKFPPRRPGQINDRVMTPGVLQYFFCQRVDFISNLSELELRTLQRCYPQESYREIIPTAPSPYAGQRQFERFDSKIEANLVLSDRRCIETHILDASHAGFRAYLGADIRFGTEVKVHIHLKDESQPLSIEAYPVWKGDDQVYGFRIRTTSLSWLNFVKGLNSDQEKLAS